MILLKDSLIDYIFLSRKISLPLSALKIIYENLSFNEIMNFSDNKFRKYLNSFKNAYKTPIRDIDEKIKRFSSYKNDGTIYKIEKDLEICKENQIKCLSFFDKDYPQILKFIKSPPKFIFIKGEIKPEDEKAVAIIGTRSPTPYGQKMAKEIAKRLSKKGFTIASGFAKGIDTIAIKSALESGGRAIGVIGSGILNIYPKENKALSNDLVKNGAIISEMFPFDNVTKRALQIRNKITSGLGLGNIFVEGTKSSGSKWQLKFGKEQGRPAIAVRPIGDYEQAHVPNLIIEQEKGDVISNLEDLKYIAEMLLNEYEKRKKKRKRIDSNFPKQTNLFKF